MFGKKKSLTIAIFFLWVVISAPAPGTGLDKELELDAKEEAVDPMIESMAQRGLKNCPAASEHIGLRASFLRRKYQQLGSKR